MNERCLCYAVYLYQDLDDDGNGKEQQVLLQIEQQALVQAAIQLLAKNLNPTDQGGISAVSCIYIHYTHVSMPCLTSNSSCFYKYDNSALSFPSTCITRYWFETDQSNLGGADAPSLIVVALLY